MFQICWIYTKEFCHLFAPNLLNLHKGILSKISSYIVQSGESCLFPIFDVFSCALALACLFFDLFMRLQSDESCTTFYTKEFCQKKVPQIFNLVKFIHFPSLVFFKIYISPIACFFLKLFMMVQSGESCITFYIKEFCQKNSSNFQSGEFY